MFDYVIGFFIGIPIGLIGVVITLVSMVAIKFFWQKLWE